MHTFFRYIHKVQGRFTSFNRYRGFAIASTVSVISICSLTASANKFALCDENKSEEAGTVEDESESSNLPPIVIPEFDDSDAAWEEDKLKCSFCRQFIVSPCKQPFKLWSKCVDIAKEQNRDFIDACKEYTRGLMDCTQENSEFFAAYKEKVERERAEAGEVDDDDDDDDDDEDSEEVEETGKDEKVVEAENNESSSNEKKQE
jgi:hypothetical protein